MDIAVFTQNETLVESILTSVVGTKLWRNQTDGRGEGTAGFGYEAVVDIVPPPARHLFSTTTTTTTTTAYGPTTTHLRSPASGYISMRLLPLCLL